MPLRSFDPPSVGCPPRFGRSLPSKIQTQTQTQSHPQTQSHTQPLTERRRHRGGGINRDTQAHTHVLALRGDKHMLDASHLVQSCAVTMLQSYKLQIRVTLLRSYKVERLHTHGDNESDVGTGRSCVRSETRLCSHDHLH